MDRKEGVYVSFCTSAFNRAAKKNKSHGNEVLLQGTVHLIQRPCYQRGSTCQDPAGNRTTQRPPDHHKEMQTAVVWSCIPFIRSCQNLLTKNSERGKKTKQSVEEVGRQHPGKWRKLVLKSSMVQQQLLRLKDR